MWPFSRPVMTLGQKAVIVVTEGALLGAYAASAAITYVATTQVAAMTVEATAKGLELSAKAATALADKARKAVASKAKPEIAPATDAPKGAEAGGTEQPAAA